MPHERKRHLEAIISNFLKASPIVGVIGHRQTGKTTLCSGFAESLASLDREEDLILCERGPTEFIRNRPPPFMIDESQLSPRLFPALKDAVRTHKAPGQFLLTGSVRFTSRKAIRESLTGRILMAELLPLSWSECHEKPINDFLMRIHKGGAISLPRSFRPRALADEGVIRSYLDKGGLPGICFSRNGSHRNSRFKTHMDTLLDRDIRLVVETSLPKMTLLGLAKTLARLQGHPINWESLRRETGISVVTLKRLFSAFEALFLLRPLSRVGRSTADTYYFEDAGLASYLAGFSNTSFSLPEFTHFLFCNLREAYHYGLAPSYEVQNYWTRGGAHVPLVFQSFGTSMGIVPVLDRQPTASSLRSSESFLKKYPKSKVVVAHFGTEARTLHSRLASIPWNWLV